MAGKLAGFRILVAEDEWRLAEVLLDLINLHDGTVVGPVSNEDEAREIMSGAAIDAAVLDVVLANGPCCSLVDELTERNVPVILTTGYTVSQLPNNFSRLPVFSKPFHMGTLIDRVAEQCRGQSGVPA